MSIRAQPYASIKAPDVAALESALKQFYENPPPTYYQIADAANEVYTPDHHPFHSDVVRQVQPGTSVLELGCGTAHLCRHVEAAGASYTGADYSAALLQANRKRYPAAEFVVMGTELPKRFDIIASFYTIEHVADPLKHLELMWRYCKPGGLLAVICPEFIESPGYAPSVFFGSKPGRFREKLRNLELRDAVMHLIDHLWLAPRWKERARSSPPGSFWINTRPSVLAGGKYSIDADAVHLSRLRDVVWFFERKGASIVRTSSTMAGINPDVLRWNCYVLAQKPTSSGETNV